MTLDSLGLTATDGNRLEVRIELEQDADPQDVKTPGLTPGTTARLTAFKSKGTGQAVLELDQLFPTDTTMNVANDSSLTLAARGIRQEVDQHTEVTTKVAVTNR